MSAGFSSKVAELVEAHVMVKRYLVFKYPAYHDALSSASKITLKYQVGHRLGERVYTTVAFC